MASTLPATTPRHLPVETVRTARRGPVRRHRLLVGGLLLALLTAFTVRTLLGDYTITVVDAFRIVGGADVPVASFILMESKLPRATLSLLVGAAMGVGGAIFQTTLRNPLASPDIIGVSLGASAAAAFAIVELGLAGPWLSGAAVAGAVLTAAAVRLAAGTTRGYRLVLVGVASAAALMSVVQYLFTRADEQDAHRALRWLTGSVSDADWGTIRVLAVILLVLTPVVVHLARSLRISELGEDTAEGLGVTGRRTDLLLLVAVLLTAAGVAAAGPVAFVSFLAGPIARALNRGRTTLLGAALVGATVVVAADHLAAYLIPGVNIPVGVVTGACGAPFLLWLLTRSRTGRSAT